jgi:hypothetical protein
MKCGALSFDPHAAGVLHFLHCFVSGGAVAQLGARLDGIEEVVGSNPIGSTKHANLLSFQFQYLCLGKYNFAGVRFCPDPTNHESVIPTRRPQPSAACGGGICCHLRNSALSLKPGTLTCTASLCVRKKLARNDPAKQRNLIYGKIRLQHSLHVFGRSGRVFR